MKCLAKIIQDKDNLIYLQKYILVGLSMNLKAAKPVIEFNKSCLSCLIIISIFTLCISGTAYAEINEIILKKCFLQTIKQELKSHQARSLDMKAHPEKNIEYGRNTQSTDSSSRAPNWHACYSEYYGYEYKIQKTNSIIAPYVGMVTFSGKLFEKKGLTQSDCINAKWTYRTGSKITLKYVYRNGVWVLTEVPANYRKY